MSILPPFSRWAVTAAAVALLAGAGACGENPNTEPNTELDQPRPALAKSSEKPRGGADQSQRIQWVPASRHAYERARRPDSQIRRIVIHVAQAPSAASVVNTFKNGNAAASSHYVVSSSGEVIQMVRDRNIAWHAGNGAYNATSIGIEHVGFVDNKRSLTPRMFRASARLVASLAEKYGIPLDRRHVIGHDDVPDPNNPRARGGFDHHRDPGPHWRWDKYMREARRDARAYEAPAPVQEEARKSKVTSKRERARTARAHGAILGPNRVKIADAQAWARAKGATPRFESLATLYWKLAPARNVRSEVAYAQAAKETNFGHFGGVLDASFHNPCGLKKTNGGRNDDPGAHKRFRSWRVGVVAHLDHLALYAGAPDYPRVGSPDPRDFRSLHGKASSMKALGGAWAPAPSYGKSIAELVASLHAR